MSQRCLRTIASARALAAAASLLAMWALTLGSLQLSFADVARSFFGADGFAAEVVREWRAPRVVGALVFGAALGIAGALFQTITRNPLGSPDIIGFSAGSYTGVILARTILAGSFLSDSLGALLGGFATAAGVYLLSYRGGIAGSRLIVVGIGATAMLSSINTWLLLRARQEVALGAAMWGAGSINLASWSDVASPLVLLAASIPLLCAALRPLRQLELGDDVAAAHGLRVEPTRLGILGLGVALTAAVTAAAGPISFVALAAPQIARRTARGAGIPIFHSALTGAIILLAADMIGQHVPAQPVPAGAVTVIFGGLYLLWYLIGEGHRRGR